MIKATKTLRDALQFLDVPVEFLCPTIPTMGSTVIDLSSGQLQVCDYRSLGGYEIDWALAKYNLAGQMVGRVNVRRKV